MVGNGSDPLVSNPIVTSGPRSGVAHSSFKNRQLESGDTVLIELGACVSRYGGALMRWRGSRRASSEISQCAMWCCKHSMPPLPQFARASRPVRWTKHAEVLNRETPGMGAMFRKRTGYFYGPVAFAPDWGEA